MEGRNLPAISAMPVGEALGFFERLRLPGQRGEIGAKVIHEVATARCASWRTWGSTISPWSAAPRPSRAGRPSASASPARSAPAWWG